MISHTHSPRCRPQWLRESQPLNEAGSYLARSPERTRTWYLPKPSAQPKWDTRSVFMQSSVDSNSEFSSSQTVCYTMVNVSSLPYNLSIAGERIVGCILSQGGVCGLTVTVVGNEHDEASSNPGRDFAFHITFIPLGKVSCQLFSLQPWTNSRTNWAVKSCYGNQSRGRKILN